MLSQEDLDSLLRINEFIDEEDNNNSLIGEIKRAILDSGQLELGQWEILRDHIREIEELIPHIDLIIKLKKDLKLSFIRIFSVHNIYVYVDACTNSV